MGASCGCSEQDDKIRELQKLVAEQKDEYQILEDNLVKITADTKELEEKNANSSSKVKSRIKSLEHEKKQVFKEMMKERRKIAQLEETKAELERTRRNMKKQISEYEQQIFKFKERESSASKDEHFVEENEFESKTHIDIETDIDDINDWFSTRSGEKKKDHKIFTKKMTELLTKRPKQHCLRLVRKWDERFNKSLLEQIEYKLNGKTQAVPYRVLSALLQSTAEIDVRWIQELMYNEMQIEPVANVICARSVNELIAIKKFWATEYGASSAGSSMLAMLEKLAKHYNKHTMLCMFKNLCNTEKRQRNDEMQSRVKVNLIEIYKHIDWMVLANKYKHEHKEKMCRLVTINSNDYICILSKQYTLKSKTGEHIGMYIERKYGKKSSAALHLQNHVDFVENKNLYFANKLAKLAENGEKFKENHLEILNIFLSRFKTDLSQIQLEFVKAYGQSLRQYIKENGTTHNSMYFLMKILDNAKKFS